MFCHVILPLAFVLLCLPGYGQADSLRLRIRIVDSFSRETLDGVSVTVCDQDSATVLLNHMRRQRTYTNGFAVEDDYAANVPIRPAYVLKARLAGYEELCVRVEMPKRRRKLKEWNAKDLLMRKSSSALDRTLEEATVTASRIAMVVKGDTVEYDARAFRLAEGSMLDNLMAMLPGVSLTEDGRIYVNGEYVQRLMVNGRDFFKGNPKVALDNLPAYVVDKINVYHEGPEWEHLLDEKNKLHGKRPLAMDVRLKREYAQGWLANFEAGGGTKTKDGWNDVYLARLFAMRYTDHSGLAIYGSMNNLGDNQSPGRKGEWKKMDVTKGERTVKVGGINLDIDGKRTRTRFTSTVEARREDALSDMATTSMLNEGRYRQLRRHDSHSDNGQTEVTWKGEVKTQSKRTHFQISPYLKYLHNKKEETTSTAQQSSGQENGIGDAWEKGYTRNTSLAERSDNWETGVKISGNVKSPFSGKNYRIGGEIKYARTEGSASQWDDISYAAEALSARNRREHWRDALPRKKYLYGISAGRNLLEKSCGKLAYRLDVSYDYRQTYESGARTRELQELPEEGLRENPFPAGSELPSATAGEQWKIDEANTYRTAQMEHRHFPGLYLNLNGLNLNFDGNVYANFSRRNVRDAREHATRFLERQDFYFTFYGGMSFQPWGMRLDYSYMPKLPSMLQLLDVRDASDPLNVYIGNGALEKTTRHRIQLSHNSRKSAKQRTVHAALSSEIIANAVGNARSYDAQTGVTTYRPRNVHGNWQGRMDLEYGQALDRKGHLMLSSKAWFLFTHSVDFADDAVTGGSFRSVVDNYQLNEELSLYYRTMKGIQVGAKGLVCHLRQRSKPLASRSSSATDYSYGLTLTLPLTKHLGFETDIMAYGRRGYTERSMNTTDWVWNAALSLTLGKHKEWLVRAVGFDLLHQLSSVRREVNAQGYVETRYNTVPAYASLHLIYRLNIKPRKR